MSEFVDIAQDLLNLYRATPESKGRFLLHPPLNNALDWLRSDALLASGHERKDGYIDPRKHIWNTQVVYMTGRLPDRDAYCGAELKTRSYSGCKNRPMLGVKHCHLHGSEAEKVEAARAMERWKTYLDGAIVRDGSAKIVHDIEVAMKEPT